MDSLLTTDWLVPIGWIHDDDDDEDAAADADGAVVTAAAVDTKW